MIIARAPFRVSLLGGGTDYPEFLAEQDAVVLSTTIRRYCYVMLRRLPEYHAIRHRAVWSFIENVDSYTGIFHPAIRAGIERYLDGDEERWEVIHWADLPARSGMGSSSAFACAFIAAAWTERERRFTKIDLAAEAIRFEREILGEAGGVQDQIACALGGENVIRLGRNTTTIQHASLDTIVDLGRLYFLGTARSSVKIAEGLAGSVTKNHAVLRAMVGYAENGVACLESGDEGGFFQAFRDTFSAKQKLSPDIVPSNLAKMIDKLPGSCKLLGAGGTGFLLVFSRGQEEVHDIIADYVGKEPFSLPLEIEKGDEVGTQIVCR